VAGPDESAPLRPWLRIDAALYSDAALIRGGFAAGVAFLAVLTRAKLLGRYGGRLDPSDVDPLVLARHVNGGPEHEALLAQGIAALRDGTPPLIVPSAGGGLVLVHWWRYQSDPGHAARQRTYVERKKAATDGVTSPDVSSSSSVTDRHADDDGTGRDGTGRDREPPQPPRRGGSSASPSTNGNGADLSTSDRQVFEALWRRCGCDLSPGRKFRAQADALRSTLLTPHPDVAGVVAFLDEHSVASADVIEEVAQIRRNAAMAYKARGRRTR